MKPWCFAIVLLFGLLPSAFPWGAAHFEMTGAAFAVQSAEFRERFSKAHVDPFDGTKKPLSWFLTRQFTMHPDAVDGPCRLESDIPKRLRATKFVYAQREGKYMVPIAYSDPDKALKGARPKTYHYFTLKTEELNRIFAEKGVRWYFEKIGQALREKRDADAAEYLGALAHAIEDRVSPYHVWDGYNDQREEVENQYPELQKPEASWKGSPKGASLIWALSGKNVKVDLGSYKPEILGPDMESAGREFTKRLFASREHARKIYTEENGYIRVHQQDDWLNKEAGKETNQILNRIAEENARLVADVMKTAWFLADQEK